MAELLPFNEIQDGGQRHLEFSSGDYFCHLFPFGFVAGDVCVKFHNRSSISVASEGI